MRPRPTLQKNDSRKYKSRSDAINFLEQAGPPLPSGIRGRVPSPENQALIGTQPTSRPRRISERCNEGPCPPGAFPRKWHGSSGYSRFVPDLGGDDHGHAIRKRRPEATVVLVRVVHAPRGGDVILLDGTESRGRSGATPKGGQPIGHRSGNQASPVSRDHDAFRGLQRLSNLGPPRRSRWMMRNIERLLVDLAVLPHGRWRQQR